MPFRLVCLIVSFPCGVCSKTVANINNALCCDSCDKWIHIKLALQIKKLTKSFKKISLLGSVLIVLRTNCLFQSQVKTDPNQSYVLPHKHSTQNIQTQMKIFLLQNTTHIVNSALDRDLKNSNLFIHLNISSLELNLLLSQIKHRPQIIAISETWIRKNKTASKIDIPG